MAENAPEPTVPLSVYTAEISRRDTCIGQLETQLANYEKALCIISVRSKLESFVNKMYPRGINKKTQETIYGKPDKLPVCDALSEIVSSSDPRFVNDVFIRMVRYRLKKSSITPAVFLKFARWLYSQFSDKTCHKMSAFSPPLPNYTDVKAIEDMLKTVEIDTDIPAVVCIQIILEPLGLPQP